MKTNRTHGTCQHQQYRLTCEQFEVMLGRADDRCEKCGQRTELLQIDHDHTTGELRGLLCPRCNTELAAVDRGRISASEATAQYLSLGNPVPEAAPSKRTPIMTFRARDALWDAAKERAAERGETVTDVIVRALERYVKR